jgi:hypothetical protein
VDTIPWSDLFLLSPEVTVIAKVASIISLCVCVCVYVCGSITPPKIPGFNLWNLRLSPYNEKGPLQRGIKCGCQDRGVVPGQLAGLNAIRSALIRGGKRAEAETRARNWWPPGVGREGFSPGASALVLAQQ